jgi:dTDP-4-dehydrorhamnose reductase
VTGGKGMLGAAIFREGSAFQKFDIRAPGHDELDVRDADAVNSWAKWVEGGWIVHCAARVDVEGCAREPDAARLTIVEGTRNAANLARQSKARLLYPQSFLVYDGRENPIGEAEEPRPLSLYGQLKYEAQQVAESTIDDALIIRMAGFFGGEEADKNFVGRIIPVMWAAMQRGETQFQVGTRVWQPTWTEDLAVNSLHLMSQGAKGRYQMACVGHATFAEIAQEIAIALKWTDRFEIVAVDPAAVTQSELGRRPDVAILSCDRLTKENANLQRPWRATLHAYLARSFFDQYRLEAAQ